MPIKRAGAAEICEEEIKDLYFDQNQTETKSRNESQLSFIDSQDKKSVIIAQQR